MSPTVFACVILGLLVIGFGASLPVAPYPEAEEESEVSDPSYFPHEDLSAFTRAKWKTIPPYKRFTVIGFYTVPPAADAVTGQSIQNRYEAAAKTLAMSCKQRGIPYRITKYTDVDIHELRGNKTGLIYAAKPAFMLRELEDLGTAVLYVDVDVEFQKFPDLLVEFDDVDFAAVNNHKWNRRRPSQTPWDGKQLFASSGVVYFNNTETAKTILNGWIRAVRWGENSKAADDQVLDQVWNRGRLWDRVRYEWLPRGYLNMGYPQKRSGKSQEEVVIVHPVGVTSKKTVKPNVPDSIIREL